jgi:hypothetical protein
MYLFVWNLVHFWDVTSHEVISPFVIGFGKLVWQKTNYMSLITFSCCCFPATSIVLRSNRFARETPGCRYGI